jgi:hypothetical protein
MARLGMEENLEAERLRPGDVWRLSTPLNAYSRPHGSGLATQVAVGRHLRLLEPCPPHLKSAAQRHHPTRWRIRLLEDGYPCWMDATELLAHGQPALRPPLLRMDRATIAARIPAVLTFARRALDVPNVYLWGGTLGPDFDCSGLIQTAYATAGVWLPRDAYLQELFCRPVAVHPGQTSLLQPGDLIFFGTTQRCTHVGLHLGGGHFLHSSGQQHGRDGLGIDDLNPTNRHPVACHYRAELRGAGRVTHSHDGSPLPP